MGGMIYGTRKIIESKNLWISQKKNIMAVDVKIQDDWVKIIGIYNSNGIDRIRKELEQLCNVHTERIIMMGDWNARVGTLGDINNNKRNTKDLVINQEGKKWVELVDQLGMMILNGNMDGDWEGEYTHDGPHNSSVIDYAAATTMLVSELTSFTVEQQVESDHHPIVISYGKYNSIENSQLMATEKIQDWSDRGVQKYKIALENLWRKPDTAEWHDIAERITKATTIRQRITYASNSKRWFDKECYDMRNEVRNNLRRNRQMEIHRSVYLASRSRYKTLIKQKKKKNEDMFLNRLSEVRNPADAWKFINMEREKKKRKEIGVSEDELMNHFKTLLQGTEKPDTNVTPVAITDTAPPITLKEIERIINNC